MQSELKPKVTIRHASCVLIRDISLNDLLYEEHRVCSTDLSVKSAVEKVKQIQETYPEAEVFFETDPVYGVCIVTRIKKERKKAK